MPIEISGHPSTTLAGSSDAFRVQEKVEDPSPAQQETGKPSTLETVSLSDTAKTLKQLESMIASQPVVDVQRVDLIRNSLKQGQLEFNSLRIAEKVSSFEAAFSVK